ncbi:MAG: hypothetical protein M1820_004398 [Bogoriella megaspora]|nr:MAG: hypothetical protein M1820_004398 [Bogoriella megaspora]
MSSHAPKGQRLLPTTIDTIARETPDRICMSLPRTSNLADDGFEDITFARFANAINRLTWWMEGSFGKAEGFETVAYIGRSDARYLVLGVAAAKGGWKALFSSHMNSLPGHLNLLEKCGCSKFMSAEGVDVADILESRQMKHFIIPSLDEILDPEPVERYPYDKTWDEAQRDPYLILHTSGTTGLPKPVTLTLKVAAYIDAHSTVDVLPSKDLGYKRCNRMAAYRGRLLCPFAPFHVIIMGKVLPLMVYGETVLVFPLREGMASPPQIINAIDHGNVSRAFLSPALLTELAKSEAGISRLEKLEKTFYGGGTLPHQAGNLIASRTHLINIFGSTEIGAPVSGELPSEDWEWVALDPDYNGLEWRKQSDSFSAGKLYEPVMVKNKDIEPHQVVFLIYPHLNEWPLGDLWTKHPERPHTWKYAGRNDDLICYSNGLKYHPLETESRISSHEFVQAALMFGHAHLQPVLLVELRTEIAQQTTADNEKRKEVEDSIWRLVEEMNVDAPSVGKVARTHILYTKPGKPLLRASKGTVQRWASVEEYKTEIEDVYRKFGDVPVKMMGRTEGQRS